MSSSSNSDVSTNLTISQNISTLLMLFVLWVDVAISAPSTFYVMPEGNDRWSGRKMEASRNDGPFATLERARQALRAAGGGEVVVGGGTYELKAPMVLGPKDSGTPQAPRVYRAAKDAEVRISAGRDISGFRVLNDAARLALLPKVARGRVLHTNIKEQGIEAFGEPTGGFGRDGLPGLELFINDQPLVLARYPSEGYMRIAAVHGATEKEVRGRVGTVEGIITYEDMRPERWIREKAPMALGFWFWDWAEHRQRIAEIDPAQQRLLLAEPHARYGYRVGQRFYGFNLFSEIDQPGEWYLDRETGDLFV